MINIDDYKPLCPGCFEDKGDTTQCPHCKFDESKGRSALFLPYRTILKEQYIVGRELGKPGGFGITYLAFDCNLEICVAIKEYFPKEIACRGRDTKSIEPDLVDNHDDYQNGLKGFREEARRLAKFQKDSPNPNIVSVKTSFYENGTGYFVMEYYPGRNLCEFLHENGGRVSESVAMDLMMPVLDGLREVHRHGFVHRDIKPANIYITNDGRPILIDFGISRLITRSSRSMTAIVSEGYAPYEQYGRQARQLIMLSVNDKSSKQKEIDNFKYKSSANKCAVLILNVTSHPSNGWTVAAFTDEGKFISKELLEGVDNKLSIELNKVESDEDKEKITELAASYLGLTGRQGSWTDIYACGATLYTMVTGEVPLFARFRMAHDNLAAPDKLNSTVSPGFSKAILNAMAVEPKDRPKDVEGFQGILKPKEEEGPQPPEQEEAPKPPIPAWLWGAGGLGIGAIIAVVVILFMIKSGKESADSFYGGDKLAAEQEKSKEVLKKMTANNDKDRSFKVNPAKQTGTLKIESEPSFAGIYIEDKYYGKTSDAILTLEASVYEVTVKKEGYKDATKKVVVNGGKEQILKLNLESKASTVKVESEPSSAGIYIGGEYYGKTPGSINVIKPGYLTIDLKLDGYKKWSKRIQVEAGKDKEVSAVLISSGPAATYTDNVTGMEFVYVKEGCYQMGDTFGDGDDNEKPVHEVCLDGFYIGIYEVTQGQWKDVMGYNPSNSKRGRNYPVEMVSSYDAQAFIKKLNQKTGKTYSLPTEAEWEYAARSGGKREKYAGQSSESELEHCAWYISNSKVYTTHPVGLRKPNRLGIYDMAGNVYEWCQDVYNVDAYRKHHRNNPIYNKSGSYRVFRGGCWSEHPSDLRASNRAYDTPSERNGALGFRLTRTP